MSSEKTEATADLVKIGSFGASHYLLKGLAYLDQLLLGKEMIDCLVVFVTLESWADVIAHWEENDGTIPWAIHPDIVVRLKQDLEERDFSVRREAQKSSLAGLEDDDEGWLDNLKG